MDNMLPSAKLDLVDVFKQKHVLSVCFQDIRVLIINLISKKNKKLTSERCWAMFRIFIVG